MNKGIKPGPGGWTTIEVARPGDATSIRALIIGPFSVHKNMTGNPTSPYTVTHTRSGLVVRHLPGFAEARALALDLRGLFAPDLDDLDTADFGLVQRVMLRRGAKMRALFKDHKARRQNLGATITNGLYEPFREAPCHKAE